MKKSALTVAISSLLLAGSVHAATVYENNGNKLDLGGRLQGDYYGTDDDAYQPDQSYVRANIGGEIGIASETKAFGFSEYNLPLAGSDNSELRYAYAGIKHDRFGTLRYGRQDGLFSVVNNYTDVLPEWGGDGLGKNVEVFGTGRTYNLTQYMYSQSGLTLGVQYTGSNNPQHAGRTDISESFSANAYEGKKWNSTGSRDGFALAASYDFDTGLSLATAYNQAKKTIEQARYAAFGGGKDAKLLGAGVKYVAGDLYLAATVSHGKDHLFVNNGYADKHNGLEAVAQYTIGKFKPSLAYVYTHVKDSAQDIDGAYTKYVSIGGWYNFTDNFNAYFDYKRNLLNPMHGQSINSLGQSTDNILAVALQYNF